MILSFPHLQKILELVVDVDDSWRMMNRQEVGDRRDRRAEADSHTPLAASTDGSSCYYEFNVLQIITSIWWVFLSNRHHKLLKNIRI